MTVNVDALVETYIALRDHKEMIKRRHVEELKPINADMDKLEGRMLAFLTETQQQSASTAHGVVYRSTEWKASISDKEAFMDYVIESERWELLDKKVNKTAARAYTEENKKPPPGVNLSSETTVNINRKSGV